MAALSPSVPQSCLWHWAVFGGMLSAAGLPIYLHAPKFYVDTYGVNLATLGAVLAVLRLIDVVQDPALGWLAPPGSRGAIPAVWWLWLRR